MFHYTHIFQIQYTFIFIYNYKYMYLFIYKLNISCSIIMFKSHTCNFIMIYKLNTFNSSYDLWPLHCIKIIVNTLVCYDVGKV